MLISRKDKQKVSLDVRSGTKVTFLENCCTSVSFLS